MQQTDFSISTGVLTGYKQAVLLILKKFESHLPYFSCITTAKSWKCSIILHNIWDNIQIWRQNHVLYHILNIARLDTFQYIHSEDKL